MNDRWDEIESVFNKVLEADESRRSAVLEKFCAGDRWLKREVESLLAHYRDARDFIERPAFEDVGSSPSRGVAPSEQSRASLNGELVAH